MREGGEGGNEGKCEREGGREGRRRKGGGRVRGGGREGEEGGRECLHLTAAEFASLV